MRARRVGDHSPACSGVTHVLVRFALGGYEGRGLLDAAPLCSGNRGVPFCAAATAPFGTRALVAGGTRPRTSPPLSGTLGRRGTSPEDVSAPGRGSREERGTSGGRVVFGESHGRRRRRDGTRCTQAGERADVPCAEIATAAGGSVPWARRAAHVRLAGAGDGRPRSPGEGAVDGVGLCSRIEHSARRRSVWLSRHVRVRRARGRRRRMRGGRAFCEEARCVQYLGLGSLDACAVYCEERRGEERYAARTPRLGHSNCRCERESVWWRCEARDARGCGRRVRASASGSVVVLADVCGISCEHGRVCSSRTSSSAAE
ncbi:hypothetical protein C2E23DRAFT_376949 [Lenzites betulinus]|nr:hypothetical protein C2E23DRAFT_376949 [Lenzites betulinus]